MTTIKIQDLADLPQAAATFIAAMNNHRIFAFNGSMGAGKTTFIKAICEGMGVEDMINSPTFAIVNEYRTANAAQVFHFDYYRVKDLEEAYNIGSEDYFYSGGYCFIEWPEKVAELLPSETINVFIEEMADGSREIRF